MESEYKIETSTENEDRWLYKLDLKLRIAATIISFILIAMVLLHIYIVVRYYHRHPGTFNPEPDKKGHVPIMSIPII